MDSNTIIQKPIIKNHSLQELQTAFEAKREYFDAGNTYPYDFRIAALKKLLIAIKKYNSDIKKALYLDYKKPETEAVIGDIGVVIEELKFTIARLKSWMKPKRVGTPITLMPASSKIVFEPKGVVAIFAPWNYPVNLILSPLIGAIAAGNCCMIKPAHETPHTAILIEKMIKEVFDFQHVSVVMGEGKMMGEMMLQNFVFNHIFFTGSANTGKWIMEQAAKNLTSVTLELGGKCPAIIDSSARLEVTIQRILWAKFFNAGQTCLSVDYVLVHRSISDKFINGLKDAITKTYGLDASTSKDYCRIVNSERTKRLTQFLENGEIIFGGKYDIEGCYLGPTLIKVTDMDSHIMKEEIFGPILPILVWDKIEDVVRVVRKNRYPLACYIFSEDSNFIDNIIQKVEFGGGCINNALAHFGNSHFPFGGVMTSGIGKYHGHKSFESFSNAKPILNSMSMFDLHIWYPPYTETKTKIIEKVIG